MNEAERRARAIFHAGNRVVALAVSACLLALLGFGIGTVPALGPALVPGHGAWRSAANATLPVRQTLSLAGLGSPASSPEPVGGDLAAVHASEGGINSEIGPSWSMLVEWATAGAGAGVAEGKYSGRQSKDPASPWYSDLMGAPQAGTYLPMPAAGASAASSGATSWELRP
jgi:hypothetical protein